MKKVANSTLNSMLFLKHFIFLPISSHKLLKRDVLVDKDVIKSIYLTALSKTFLSERDFLPLPLLPAKKCVVVKNTVTTITVGCWACFVWKQPHAVLSTISENIETVKKVNNVLKLS